MIFLSVSCFLFEFAWGNSNISIDIGSTVGTNYCNNCTDFLPNEAGQMLVITANASAFAITLKVKKSHFDLKG